NRAATRQRQNERELAGVEELRLVNQGRREVAAAKALVEARRQSIETAGRRVQIAMKAFNEDYTRIRGGIGLAIEIIDTVDRLAQSRLGLIEVLASYNLAEFQL